MTFVGVLVVCYKLILTPLNTCRSECHNHPYSHNSYQYISTCKTIEKLVCLLVWGFSFHSRIVHSYVDITITSDGLQILTYARHLRPMSSEGSLACHTHCDKGHPFIWSYPRTRDTCTLMPRVWQWSCHYMF